MTKKNNPVKKVAAGMKNSKRSDFSFYRKYRIVYEENNPDDRYGIIEYVYEGSNSKEFLRHQGKSKKEEVTIPVEFYLEMLKKVKSAKNNKPFKFSKFEGEVLETALNLSIKFQASLESELKNLRFDLAWANTAFLNKENSYEKNLREAGRRLGFTKSKHTPPKNLEELKTQIKRGEKTGKKLRYNQAAIENYYRKTLNDKKERKDRIAAVKKTKKKFDFASDDACSKYLRKIRLQNIPDFRPK